MWCGRHIWKHPWAKCRIALTFREEGGTNALEVALQCDGDDGKVCRERKHGEETEHVVDDGEIPRVIRLRLEVERVEVVDLLEGEYSS